MRKNRITRLMLFIGSFLLISNAFNVSGQSKYANKYNLKIISEQQTELDSLVSVVDNLRVVLFKTDSLYKSEKITSASLRDEIIKLDDYRQKLEQNNNAFKGENLKLNQSNRILIIFNSLVAILLVVTLVFFLKRLSRKKTGQSTLQFESVNESESTVTPFANFEDRLMQLERLGKLREKGLLSEDEFISQKQSILGK